MKVDEGLEVYLHPFLLSALNEVSVFTLTTHPFYFQGKSTHQPSNKWLNSLQYLSPRLGMEIGLISLLGFEARTIDYAAWSLHRLSQYCEWLTGLL
jgi:hypothetical protein